MRDPNCLMSVRNLLTCTAMKALLFVLSVTVAVVSIAGCDSAVTGDARAVKRSSNHVLRIAVTTSTRDSGLLDVLVPEFEKEQGVRVDIIAAGTGKALKLGETGDVDVVLVHARQAEEEFMSAGHGIRREDVMFNTFEIVGPKNDPAGIRDMDPVRALNKIAKEGQQFVSRGDDSGTHKRELNLWSKDGIRPDWDNYIENGQGMGATLTMADQLHAYTLTDRGTYLAMQETIDLVPLSAATDELKNPYGIIVVDPNKHERINERAGQAFVDFIISARAQKVIRDFKVDGESLFHPLRLETES